MSGKKTKTKFIEQSFNVLLYSLLFLCFASKGTAQQRPHPGQKSAAKAFFYSFLVPGLGQRYVDEVGNARYFIAAEGLLLGFAAGHELYSNWLEEDYRAFAALHAGIDPAGKSKFYYIEISRYNSIYIYNEKMRLNRDFNKVIPEISSNLWVWDSKENRLNYHDRRVKADKIQNRTIYFYTGIFMNHVISGIHASIKARRSPDQTMENSSWHLRFKTSNPYNPTHSLSLTFRF